MNIPTKTDWGNIDGDLDIKDAYQDFYGKTNDEMEKEFKANIFERCSSLRCMPIEPFKYYIFGLKQYIDRSEYDDFHRPDAASCFIDLIYERLMSNIDSMRSIMDELLPTILKIANNQELFEADIDIYGDFGEMLEKIKALL
jgi:hypothetical protein